MLPGRSWFSQELDASPAQFLDGSWQIPDGEADNRRGGEVLLAGVTTAEHFNMAAIRELEDAELRFPMHQSEAKDMFVEVR